MFYAFDKAKSLLLVLSNTMASSSFPSLAFTAGAVWTAGWMWVGLFLKEGLWELSFTQNHLSITPTRTIKTQSTIYMHYLITPSYCLFITDISLVKSFFSIDMFLFQYRWVSICCFWFIISMKTHLVETQHHKLCVSLCPRSLSLSPKWWSWQRSFWLMARWSWLVSVRGTVFGWRQGFVSMATT